MAEYHADVIVIGGGAAGLAAASVLATAGYRILLLEARGRLGGRIHTLYEPGWPLPVELGAEFIHGKPPEVRPLVHRAGLSVLEVQGEHWYREGNRLVHSDELWNQVSEILERLRDIGPEDLSFAQFLETYCRDAAPNAKAQATRYVEGLNAADRNLISVQSLRDAETRAQQLHADHLFRIQSGHSRLLELLCAGPSVTDLTFQLNTIVTRIVWREGHVEVESQSVTGTKLEPYTTPRLLITLPLGVLQASPNSTGVVRFVPELPEKQQALQQLCMGPVVKAVLRFDEPFWEANGVESLSFLHAPGEPFPTWWTPWPLYSSVLIGWAGGPAAAAISHQDQTAILDQAMGTLARTLAIAPAALDRRLQAWHVCDWQTDPWARGAYSYVTAAGTAAVGRLAQPVKQTLYFAGEATEGGFSGTVASAVFGSRVSRFRRKRPLDLFIGPHAAELKRGRGRTSAAA